MKKRMIFTHIPKTAGTSFRLAAQEYYGAGFVLKDYGIKSLETSSIVKQLERKKIDIVQFRKLFDDLEIKFFTGHVPANKYFGYFDKNIYVTFLRDPIQRLVSEYNHHVRHNNMKIDFTTFYRNTIHQNVQFKIVGGFEALEWMNIGITERYEESLAKINAFFDTDILFIQANLGKKSVDEKYELPDEILEEITKLNLKDIELYNKAAENFDKEVQVQKNPKQFQGSIGKLTDDKIVGWAVSDLPEACVKVDLYVNDILTQTLVADLYRHDIQEKKFKRSGMAGFKLDLKTIPNLKSGDNLSFYFHDTKTLLTNGTLVV